MKNLFVLLFVFALFGTTAGTTQAATLSIETPQGSVGARVLLPVVLSTSENESVNVIEGAIRVPEGMTVERLSTSGSDFPLFASGPTYDIGSRMIEFTAGARNPLAPSSRALLFTIEARTNTEQTYTFETTYVRAYAGDGSGSSVSVTSSPATLAIGPKGTTPETTLPKGFPAPLIAEVGKDDSLFEGKWFATFFGGASRGSVAYYEIREGWWRMPERAERYYVLKDQELRTTLWVSAVFEDGGRTTVSITPAHPWAERIVLLAITLIAGVAAYLLLRRMRKNT